MNTPSPYDSLTRGQMINQKSGSSEISIRMMQQNNQTTSKDEGSQQTPGTSKFVATNSSPATKGKRYVQ